MARVLLAWELGGGLGHLVPLAGMGRALAEAGHQCRYALRDLWHAHAVFDLDNADVRQAPVFLPEHRRGNVAHTFADILHNIGYHDSNALAGLVAAWRRLYADFQPDLVVFDHAPTAQLAAHDLGVPVVILARTGFTVPPATTPLPGLRRHESGDPARLMEGENEVLRVINGALKRFHAPRLDHVSELFRAEARVLLSLPELDPYGPREDVAYWGPLEPGGGNAPCWPEGDGPKVFGYLKPFRTLDALLRSLAASGARGLLHIGGMDARECEQRSTERLRICPELIDTSRALAECDLVITHGGSITASVLLAGKPMLVLPLYLEQQLTAERIQALGAGLNAPRLTPGGMHDKLHALLREPRFAHSAQAFATSTAQYPTPPRERFTALIDRLLNRAL